MGKVKLTGAQKLALTHGKLSKTWTSAYRLGERIPTLEGLVSRGMAERRSQLGASFDPRCNIYWRLTKEGVALKARFAKAESSHGA